MADENVTFIVKQFDEHLPPQKPSQDFDSTYDDKVLLGNWQENLSKYERSIYPMGSEYMKEYNEPKVKKIFRSVYYDNKIQGWGTDWHTVNDQGLPEEYYNNFSTIYSLTYGKACPKLINKPWRQFRGAYLEYRPQQELMINFGNTVNFGLTEYKQAQWEDEKVIDIGDAKTTTQSTYVPLPIPPIQNRRSAHKSISSSFCKISTMNPDLKTRNKNLLLCNDIPPEIVLFSKGRRPHKIIPNV